MQSFISDNPALYAKQMANKMTENEKILAGLLPDPCINLLANE
ncbi:hypothetical protein [Gilliamella sp. A7]|nr:hypothetical protein [Gilliamella sp. A7]